MYLDHVTEVMSKRLSTCIRSTKSMHRINFNLFRITLYGNDRRQLHLFYALRGETSRDLMYSFRACHGNCMHRRTCVVSKCVVVWKTVPFHDEKLMKNTLYIPENIPSRTKTKKKLILRYWFSGFNSKNQSALWANSWIDTWFFWIMFNVIWFREFCGWLSYLEYEQ